MDLETVNQVTLTFPHMTYFPFFESSFLLLLESSPFILTNSSFFFSHSYLKYDEQIDV